MHKYFAQITIAAFIAYIVFATVDTKYGLSARAAAYLP
jgi:hypothetical protein